VKQARHRKANIAQSHSHLESKNFELIEADSKIVGTMGWGWWLRGRDWSNTKFQLWRRKKFVL
jgi:hypothetical protein